VNEASGRKDDGGEALVIMDSMTAAEVQERLRSGHQVTQVDSPRRPTSSRSLMTRRLCSLGLGRVG
jgi:hypothetical protein